MTNRKPMPLKDEKPDPIEEVQEQLAELIAAVNSLAEKGNATAERQPDERFQNTLSTAVVKAVQDLLEARQRKFEEADKGKMTINEILQEILGQYDDICGKAKGFYQIYQGADARFKHIDENLQKISGNQKILYGMMKSVQQAHNIKPSNECKRPAMPSGCGITNGDKNERVLDLSLDFLDANRDYRITSYEDGVNANRQAMHYVKKERQVKKGQTLQIKMARNGGFAAVIE